MVTSFNNGDVESVSLSPTDCQSHSRRPAGLISLCSLSYVVLLKIQRKSWSTESRLIAGPVCIMLETPCLCRQMIIGLWQRVLENPRRNLLRGAAPLQRFFTRQCTINDCSVFESCKRAMLPTDTVRVAAYFICPGNHSSTRCFGTNPAPAPTV